jgi:pimeloyl-ACP methyl ester carboxylesterase
VKIEPFRIEVPQEVLDDLQDRLRRTRWTDDAPVAPARSDMLPADWAYGVSSAYVRRLVEYWRTAYDWRVWEARLNAYPQYVTQIDGQRVHFLHVKSGEPGALPIILTHGWPGSIVEYLDVLDRLTDPKAHGGDPADAFHVVVPSLPGYGFSGPTTEAGWSRYRIARAWASLMAGLGYDRYGAAGNDAGSMIAPEVGRVAPDNVVGVHVTQVFSFPSGDPEEMAMLTEEEMQGLQILQWFWENLGSFNVVQSQQPQTLAHALADSPAGTVAWMSQLFGDGVDDDFILTNIMTYWVTGTTGSALRLYYEDAQAEHPKEPTTLPLGLSMADGDFRSIRRFADRDHSNIVSWKRYPTGSHWQGHLTPDQLVADLREFYRPLR